MERMLQNQHCDRGKLPRQIVVEQTEVIRKRINQLERHKLDSKNTETQFQISKELLRVMPRCALCSHEMTHLCLETQCSDKGLLCANCTAILPEQSPHFLHRTNDVRLFLASFVHCSTKAEKHLVVMQRLREVVGELMDHCRAAIRAHEQLLQLQPPLLQELDGKVCEASKAVDRVDDFRKTAQQILETNTTFSASLFHSYKELLPTFLDLKLFKQAQSNNGDLFCFKTHELLNKIQIYSNDSTFSQIYTDSPTKLFQQSNFKAIIKVSSEQNQQFFLEPHRKFSFDFIPTTLQPPKPYRMITPMQSKLIVKDIIDFSWGGITDIQYDSHDIVRLSVIIGSKQIMVHPNNLRVLNIDLRGTLTKEMIEQISLSKKLRKLKINANYVDSKVARKICAFNNTELRCVSILRRNKPWKHLSYIFEERAMAAIQKLSRTTGLTRMPRILLNYLFDIILSE